MLFSPSAHPNKIRLRNANACAVLRRAAHRSSCERSSSVNVISTGFGPRELIHEVYHQTLSELKTQDTSDEDTAH